MDNKKALLIGINYYGSGNQLKGCQNDVEAVRLMLIEKFQFKPENIQIMKDMVDDPEHKSDGCPTKNNLLAKLQELVSTAKYGDELYIHYSGHGSTTIDLNGDEPTGYDETIVGADMQQIVDDELSNILIVGLPTGVKLRAIFDSCHSGSVLDMPYIYDSNSDITVANRSLEEDLAKNGRRINAILISGCQDDQTSEDAWVGSDIKFEGAMTWGLLKILCEHGFLQNTFSEDMQKDCTVLTWRDLISNLRKHLEDGDYIQVPQISFCHVDQLDQPLDF
jgi:hypothetical protein